jgi:hypothetical protein
VSNTPAQNSYTPPQGENSPVKLNAIGYKAKIVFHHVICLLRVTDVFYTLILVNIGSG